MFGTSELSSLTWDSAAWIYSVIIGLVIVRYFMFAANLLHNNQKLLSFIIHIWLLPHHIFFICMRIGIQVHRLTR